MHYSSSIPSLFSLQNTPQTSIKCHGKETKNLEKSQEKQKITVFLPHRDPLILPLTFAPFFHNLRSNNHRPVPLQAGHKIHHLVETVSRQPPPSYYNSWRNQNKENQTKLHLAIDASKELASNPQLHCHAQTTTNHPLSVQQPSSTVPPAHRSPHQR